MNFIVCFSSNIREASPDFTSQYISSLYLKAWKHVINCKSDILHAGTDAVKEEQA